MSKENSNEQALSAVDRKVSAVEAELSKLDDLQEAHSSISGKLAAAKSAERDALDLDGDNESAAVEKLIRSRALQDVYGARLQNLSSKIVAQTNVVVDAGRDARTYSVETAQELASFKHAVAVDNLETKFHVAPSEALHLAYSDRAYQAALALANSFVQPDSESNDVEALRHLRRDFAVVVSAVQAESGLELRFPEAWLK